ncbi:hypothetical protein M9H77_00104 [Catharanthus roseus]|nr:hypothetical protein M9H77_00104 [Catharanthus roseus]
MSLWFGARKLNIINNDPDWWKWYTIDGSDEEIVELVEIWWLEIYVVVDLKTLPLKTSYAAYLVFKLAENTGKLEEVIASVRFEKEIAPGSEDQGYTVYITKEKQSPEDTGIFPHKRADGWKELNLGGFFNNLGDEGTVKIKFAHINNSVNKKGLIIRGIELRPN